MAIEFKKITDSEIVQWSIDRVVVTLSNDGKLIDVEGTLYFNELVQILAKMKELQSEVGK